MWAWGNFDLKGLLNLEAAAKVELRFNYEQPIIERMCISPICYGGELAQPVEYSIADVDTACADFLYPKAAAGRSSVAFAVIGDGRADVSVDV